MTNLEIQQELDGEYVMRISLAPLACIAVLSASIILMPVSEGFAASFGSNLIINPGAEIGTGVADQYSIAPPPQWQATGNFTEIIYGASSGFPLATSPGPSKRGKNFFAGGPNNALSKATQLINVSTLASSIDGGGVIFALSGFFGGFLSQNDNAVMNANFLDASRRSLRQVSVGSVIASDRASQTGLLRRELKGSVPKKTRFVSITLTMTRTEGTYNDGYADNLSLVFTKTSRLGASSQELGH